MGIPWETHGRGTFGALFSRNAIEGPLKPTGRPIVVTWKIHRPRLEVPWESHGSSMGQNHKPMGDPWCTHGHTVNPEEAQGSLWKPHGRPMGVPWETQEARPLGDPSVSICSPMGVP